MCRHLAISMAGLVLLIGCAKPPPAPPAPRPVSVVTLTETDPGRFARVTGSVASWKTDELGFEVEGRVEFVSPITDADSGTIRVELSIDNSKGGVPSGVRCVLE